MPSFHPATTIIDGKAILRVRNVVRVRLKGLG